MKPTRLLPFALVFLLAACAPATQKPALIYQASPQDILSAVVEYGPQIQPADAYEYLAVEATTDNSVSFSAGLNSGLGAFVRATGNGEGAVAKLSVTVSEVNQGTLVGINATASGNRIAPDMISTMTNVLNQLFERANTVN